MNERERDRIRAKVADGFQPDREGGPRCGLCGLHESECGCLVCREVLVTPEALWSGSETLANPHVDDGLRWAL